MTRTVETLAPLMFLVLLPAAAACKEPSNPGDKGTTDPGNVDTGDTGDDTGASSCTAEVFELSPRDGDDDFFYRDKLGAIFTEPAQDLAAFTLTSEHGVDVSLKVEFDESGLNATVGPQSALEALTTYTFQVTACDSVLSTTFSTSAYGGALEMDPAALVGFTYHFDLGGAYYSEPPGLGALIGLYLSEPLLIGIASADSEQVTLLGAQGYVTDNSEVLQDTEYATFDFGSADFTTSPYFSADTDQIVIVYDDVEVPIHEFHLEGTFAPDASSIGGAMARGLGDTRNMGPLLDLDDEPDAVCELAGTYLGITCDECPDGNAYCIQLETWFDPAPHLEGLTLEVVE